MKVITLVLALFLGGEPALVLIPPQWDFGSIDGTGGEVSIEVVVENRSGRDARISFLSTCDCLRVLPTQLSLPADRSERIQLFFDPIDEFGPVQKDLIVRSNLEQLPKALYLVRGRVTGGAVDGEAGVGSGETAGDSSIAAASGEHPARLAADFYASPGCRSCERLLGRSIPKIQKRTGVSLELREHNILDPKEYASYTRLLETLGREEKAYPALVVGETVLQGEAAIEQHLEQLLENGSRQTAANVSTAAEAAAATAGRLTVLAILAAGLLDGVNPCAFTTLIFLISALAVAGRTRGQVLQIGLFFSAAVFVTYLLIGMGFFQAIRLASVFPVVASAIRWILVAVLLVFASLSLYDYFQLRSGRSDRVVLQLPMPIKRRLHRDIKSRSRSAALVASSLMLGFLVSVFELACTGQVYLPTLMYLHQVQRDAGSFSYLLLYNVAFILPLLVVFTLSYWGISSQKLTGWVQGSIKTVKLLLVALFLGLAVLTFVT